MRSRWGFSFWGASHAAMGGFQVSSLFASGEPGFWFDPSDLSTLFQDTAGTTPVTAAGQSVGLVLDKSRGLVLGPELVTNGDFDNGSTGWGLGTGWSASGGQASIDGSNAASSSLTATGFPSTVAGKAYWVEFTYSVTAGRLRLNSSIAVSSSLAAGTSGRFKQLLFSAGGSVFGIQAQDAGTVATVDSISVRELPGNHATQSTSLSRPTYQVDSNGRGYLNFDGSDDFLVTPTITPGTDKAQVFAGVRFTAAISNGTILESSGAADGNNGSFFLRQQAGGADNFQWLFRSTTNTAPTTPYTLPVTAVISATSDFAAPLTVTRLNGVQTSSALLPTGGGNFLTYTHFIGRRGGTSLPFNGRIYSLICRFGSNLTADQIAQTEAWVNSKTGAY